MDKLSKLNISNIIVWLVYLALLGVLLPHTAWAFQQFEPTGKQSSVLVAWAAAFTFEAAIAVFTHKLAKHIETVKIRKRWPRFVAMYANAYSVGLLIAVFVSVIANVLHASAFATKYKHPLFIGAFGAVLPLASLIFARILSNVNDVLQEIDPELNEAKIQLRELRKELQVSKKESKEIKSERDRVARELKATQAQVDTMNEYYEFWQTINKKTQFSIMYNAGRIPTLKEAAIKANVSESTISRIANSVNGVKDG